MSLPSIQDFINIKRATGGSMSPDGRYLVYRSNQPGTMQIFLQDLQNLKLSAVQLTDYTDSISFAVFSPTEPVLIFGKANGGNERVQFFLHNLLNKTTAQLTHNTEAIHRFGGWSRDGKRVTYSANGRNGTDFDVYVMDIPSGNNTLVYESEGTAGAAGFSPSGKYIAVRQANTNTDHDLLLVDIDTKKVTPVTPHTGSAEYGRPLWLPDESGFFYTSNEGQDFKSLAFFNTEHNTSTFVYSPKWDIDEAGITRDGTKLALGVNEDGYQRVTILDTPTLQPISCQIPTHGMADSFRFADGGNKFIYDFESPTQTSDVWILDLHTGQTKQITTSENTISVNFMAEPELIHYPSFDGLSIPAFIFLPKEAAVGEKIPAVVSIHGGPEGQYQATFAGLAHYFTGQGYAVIAPNIRGSSGYGKNYLALDNIHKRPDTFKDLAFLHTYLENRGDIDSTKIALMGGSYGGYMTLAGLAFQPSLWAAGVDIVGMSNLVTFLENTSSWRRKLRESEYGYLATDREFMESISPLNSIEAITSPLFITHGANDPRVPLSEAEQIHTKLQSLGRESELVVYADEGHGIAKLKNRLDLYPQIAKFLKKHLN